MKMSFRDLTVYQKSFDLAMQIFEISKNFPKEEKYSLTDQIKRSSRSCSAAIAEGYRKRKYEAYFVSKISNSDMENSETQVWLDFAFHCKYIGKEIYKNLLSISEEVGKLLNHMIENPEKYRRSNEK